MDIDKKYMTVSEFAEYEGVTTKTINRMIKQRKVTAAKAKGESKYRSTQNFIHYTQLSTQEAQEAFLKKGLVSKKEVKENKDQFFDLKPWQKEQADRKQAIVKEYLEAITGVSRGKLIVFKRRFSKLHSINYRTIDRWTELYKSGGYNALVPSWNPGKQEKLIDREIKQYIEKKYLVPLGPPLKKVYEDLVKEFKPKREKIPSYRTVAEDTSSTWTKSQQMLIRDKEQWNRKYSPYIRRDWNKVALNEVWIGDAKQVDVACIFRGKPVFPWFTAFLDAYSRKFVGWILTPIHDSWSIAQSFISAASVMSSVKCRIKSR